MTTRVLVNACCSDDKEVEIKISGNSDVKTIVISNKESFEDVVYDDISISVKERIKVPA